MVQIVIDTVHDTAATLRATVDFLEHLADVLQPAPEVQGRHEADKLISGGREGLRDGQRILAQRIDLDHFTHFSLLRTAIA